MRRSGLGVGLLVSVVLLLILWVAGRAFGFHVSLLGSLGMTIAMTVILNLVLGAATRRNARY